MGRTQPDLATARPAPMELLVVTPMNRLLEATPAETDACTGEVRAQLAKAYGPRQSLRHYDKYAADAQSDLFHGTQDFGRLCLRHAPGRQVWLLRRGSASARRAKASPCRISGVTLDVSVRIAAEQRLLQQTDSAGVVTWQHYLSRRITVVKGRWAEIPGSRAADVNPLPSNFPMTLVHPPGTIDRASAAFSTGPHARGRDRVPQ